MRVGAGDILVAGSASVIPISIARLSRPLAIRVVDVVAIGSMVVRAALVNKGVATAIAIAGLSRPLAVSIAAISIATVTSGQTLGAPVDRAGAAIGMVGNSAISGLSLSRPLAIVATISITTIAAIVSMKSLGRSVGEASSIAISISRLSLSVPLAVIAAISITTIAAIVTMKSLGRSVGVASGIAISRLGLSVPLAITIDVVAIGVVGGAVAIAMVSLGHIHRGRSIASIAISWLSLSLPLAVIPIAISSMETLGRSVGVAHTGVGVVGGAIAISGLGSSEAGEREDDRKRFNCHGC